MKTIVSWSLISILVTFITGCGGGNGGNATSRLPSFTGLTITTGSLPAARVGQNYSQTLSAGGGTAPYSWSVTAGALPTGLSLSGSGTISGIPASAGSSTFTVRVTDSAAPQGTAQQVLTITVNEAGTLTILTSSLPTGSLGIGYNQTLSVSGGLAPYTWSIASGALPPGLALNSAGVISGTPASAGSFTATVRVTDSNTPQGAAEVSLTIVVTSGGGALTIVTSSLPDATVGTPYSQIMVASGGVPPYHWSLMSGALPPGITLSDSGIVSGTPTTAGTYTNIEFMVTDSGSSPMVMKMLSIRVN